MARAGSLLGGISLFARVAPAPVSSSNPRVLAAAREMEINSMRRTALIGIGFVVVCLCGCTSTGPRTISANDPQTVTGIDRFELLGNAVKLHSGRTLVGPSGEPCQVLTVGLHDAFDARGFNCEEKWTLTHLRSDQAKFDVRGRYYSCTDPLAIWLGIPSRLSHWTVTVQGSAESAGQRASQRSWF